MALHPRARITLGKLDCRGLAVVAITVADGHGTSAGGSSEVNFASRLKAGSARATFSPESLLDIASIMRGGNLCRSQRFQLTVASIHVGRTLFTLEGCGLFWV